uniref:Doublecortin domain-containing protein n=1 Tax=Parascaris univalens TaxID=6257 RepID=A0A915C7R9_PARUN
MVRPPRFRISSSPKRRDVQASTDSDNSTREFLMRVKPCEVFERSRGAAQSSTMNDCSRGSNLGVEPSTPGAYDPYNRVSYLQINKAKRGDVERPENERIYNRPPPTVKKIFLKPNGDARFRIPRLESLVKEAGDFLGFEEGVAERLYDLKGHLIDDEEQVHDGSTYIVAGSEPLDLGAVSANSKPAGTEASQRPYTAESANIKGTKTDDGTATYTYKTSNRALRGADDAYSVVTELDARGTNWRDEFGEAPPKPHESISSGFGYISALEEKDEKRRAISTLATLLSQDLTSRTGNGDNEFAHAGEKVKRDGERLSTSKTRSKADKIYNRRDQTHPDAYIIYVFLNGRGMESQFLNFQRAQLEKGMKYILELIARRFGVKPANGFLQRLCNMDGHRIREISDLMSRGAYVLIPVGQSFRETWYFLPDNAIDTRSRARSLPVRKRTSSTVTKAQRKQYSMVQADQDYAARSDQALQLMESRLGKVRRSKKAADRKAVDGADLRRGALTEVPEMRIRSAEARTYENEYQEVRPGRHFSNIQTE